MENREIKSFSASAEITKLDKTNARFSSNNGFLSMIAILSDGEKKYDRVFAHRAFPFEMLWKYISILDSDSNELGVIFDLEDLDENDIETVKTELERKYYEPRIKKVESMKERYGFSYWGVVTEDGRNVKFTMQDTFKNIIRVGEDKAILLDVDGNRFVIESIEALDKKSHKKIELYL